MSWDGTEDGRWELLRGEARYHGYTRVRRDTYRLPDGEVSDWDVLEQGDTVAVVAVTSEGHAVLFSQYRVGPARVLDELPGGLIDEGEDPTEAGIRELREETGYSPADVFYAGAEWAGANSERKKHVVVATGCRRVAEPAWESGETGHVITVPLPTLIAHLLAGELSDAGEALRGLLLFLRADGLSTAQRSVQRRLNSIVLDGDGA